MGSFVTSLLSQQPSPFPTQFSGPWRPPQWSKPPLWSMTVTLPGTPSASVTTSGTNVPAQTSTSPGTQGTSTTYFFDAVLRSEHRQEAVFTEHPVQVGPAIVDHIYLRPAEVTLDVLMSDVAGVYQAGQYTGNNSKSIAAFQQFLQIQASRVPIVLATHLMQYKNMGVRAVFATDTNQTSHALRCTLYFKQIISATVSQTTVSARPDQTGATNEGTKAPQNLDSNTQNLLNNMLLPGAAGTGGFGAN